MLHKVQVGMENRSFQYNKPSFDLGGHLYNVVNIHCVVNTRICFKRYGYSVPGYMPNRDVCIRSLKDMYGNVCSGTIPNSSNLNSPTCPPTAGG